MTSNTSALQWLRGDFPAAKLNARKVASIMEAPGCVRRAVLDGAGVDTSALAKVLGLKSDRQSPFAVARKVQFELALEKNGRAEIIALARTHLHLELKEVRTRDLSDVSMRTDFGSSGESLRSKQSTAEVKRILNGDATACNLLLKPVTALQLGSLTAWLEPDVLAFAEAGRIHVVAVRNYDLMDGKADPAKAGQTAREAAAHVLSLQNIAEKLGFPRTRVSTSVLLILPRNLSFTAAGVVIDVSNYVKRLEAKLAAMPDVEQLAMDLDIPFPLPAMPDKNAGESEQLEVANLAQQVFDALPMTFADGCLSCPLFEACRNEAEAQRLTARLGAAVAGVCGDVTSVDDAVALARGTRAPTNGEERATAVILARAVAAENRAQLDAA